MGTTAQKLQAIVDSKGAIKSALNTYLNSFDACFNISVGDKLSDWAGAITNYGKTWVSPQLPGAYQFYIKYGAKFRTLPNPLASSADFANANITTVDLSNLQHGGTYSLWGAFAYCPNLSTIIFPKYGNTNVDTLPSPPGVGSTHVYSGAFCGCTNLTGKLTLNLAHGNPASNSFQYTFDNTRYNEVDITLDAAGLPSDRSYDGMFGDNPNLTKVTVRGLQNVSYASDGMFLGSNNSNYLRNCTNLQEIEFPDLEWVNYENRDGTYTHVNFGWIDPSATNELTLKFPKLRWFGVTEGGSSTAWVTMQTSQQQQRVKHVYLPSCIHVGKRSMKGLLGATVHFAAANRSAIEALQGYPNFGNDSSVHPTTFLFDL